MDLTAFINAILIRAGGERKGMRVVHDETNGTFTESWDACNAGTDR